MMYEVKVVKHAQYTTEKLHPRIQNELMIPPVAAASRTLPVPLNRSLLRVVKVKLALMSLEALIPPPSLTPRFAQLT
jgi:hypothetical protein